MAIEPDDFAIWRANPITRRLFEALGVMAIEAKNKWITDTWDGGVVDERSLADLRATAKVCTDICDMTLEELEEKAGG